MGGKTGKKSLLRKKNGYVNINIYLYICTYIHTRTYAFPSISPHARTPGKGLEAAFGFVEASHIVLPECCKVLAWGCII